MLVTTGPAIDLKLDVSVGRSIKEQKVIVAEEYILKEPKCHVESHA